MHARQARFSSQSRGCVRARCTRARCRCRPRRAAARLPAKTPSSNALKRCDVSPPSSTCTIVRTSVDRLLRIDRADRRAAADCASVRRRHRGPHDERCPAIRLARVEVHRGRWRFEQSPLLDVAHDSDDASEHRLREWQGGAAPDRIVRAPIQYCGLPADEQSLLHRCSTMSRPRSTRNPHRTQIASGDLPNLHRHRDRAEAGIPRERASVRIRRMRGRSSIVPAASTPGSARMRCNAAPKNADRWAGVGYRVPTNVTSIVSTLFGSKPVSPCLRASRLWTITPAPISSTSDSATSHTISTRRVPTPIAPSSRPPSLSASLRSARPARTASSVPASMPVSIDTPTANSSTRASIEISSALGTWLASSVEAEVSVPYASRRPSAPPAAASTALRPTVAETRVRVPRRAPSESRSLCVGSRRE